MYYNSVNISFLLNFFSDSNIRIEYQAETRNAAPAARTAKNKLESWAKRLFASSCWVASRADALKKHEKQIFSNTDYFFKTSVYQVNKFV